MTRLVIGAPVLGQDGANQKAKAAFSGAEFPLNVKVVNKMTVTLSLPEANIKLRPLASGVATFRNFDRLQRAVSSLEQIAKLNNAKALVELDAGETEVGAGGETSTEGEAGDSQSDDPAVTIVQDDDEAFIVEVQGVRFEPLRNQVREDGTLTAGGLKAFEEAKAAAEAAE
ncbi:hypothetical protein [Vreelandella aquamarina]|uniref:hypothetical protein n=1 Tax=Vreelandella aquamarina TaxID=77097 RepID=UPI00078068CB|nr:hypothetical protein [Halomonas axialensis]